ncbi:MAG: cytochrome C [Acidobacteriota bacterium]
MTNIMRGARSKTWIPGILGLVLTALFIASAGGSAWALPSYARQTGFPCAQCHTGLPELTPFGREFKLNGYVQGGGQGPAWAPWFPPVSAMVQAGFTHTQASMPGANQWFGPNNNFELDQASLFYGGAIWSQQGIGAFIQGTYDGVAREFTWDNVDIRWAGQGSLFGSDITFGATLNNNPTVQDPWNSTPAWGYPFFSSGIAPSPVAATIVDGTYGQQVLGLGAYAWWNHMVYAEISGYRTLSMSTERTLGVPSAGTSSFSGIAPYWRVAVEPSWGNNSWEIGTFGMYASVNPARITTNGTDNITDIGFDTQYQYNGERDAIGVQATYVHENANYNASAALGFTSNTNDKLDTFKIKASYFYEHTYGINVSWFNISGTSDATLYGTNNGSPNSDGWIFEANYLPFSNGGPEFWPWLNLRFGLQYTLFNHFNGGTVNFDGVGSKASGNNTLYLYMLTVF